MRHIIHLIWFDLKAAKNLIAVWAAILIVQAIVLAIGPERPDPASSINGLAADLGALIVRFGITVAFAAILIQQDVLVGTTAFWRTRPVGRLTMMAGKLAVVLIVLVLLPAFVMGLLLLSLGLWPSDALAGALSIAAEQLAVAGLSVGIAVVTATLAHFAIAAVCVLFSMMMLTRIALPALFGAWPGLFFRLSGPPAVALFAIVLVGVAAVSANQFLTFRTRRSGLVIVATVLLAAYANHLPGNVTIASAMETIDRTVAGLDNTAVSVDPATITTVQWRDPYDARSTVRTVRVSGSWEVSGVLDSVILEPSSIASRFEFGGRTMESSLSGLMGRYFYDDLGDADGQPYLSIRSALGGDTLLPRRRSGLKFREVIAEFPFELAKGHDDAISALDATVRMRALKFVVRDAVRVQPGARSTAPSRHLTVTEVSASPGGFVIWVSAILVERPRTTFLPGLWVLRNAARHQAVFVAGELKRRFVGTAGLAGRQVAADTIRFDVTVPFAGGTNPGSDVDWLKDAELVWLEAENIGSVTLPLHMDPFPLHPKPPATK